MVVQNVIELSCWERLAEATAGIGEARLFPPEPPLDAQGRMPDGFGAQFRASLARLEARLRAAGGSLDHVLRAEIRVDRSGPEAYGALQAAFLGDNREPNAVQASMAKAKAARVAGAPRRRRT